MISEKKIYFLTLFLPRFKRPMNCYFFLSFLPLSQQKLRCAHRWYVLCFSFVFWEWKLNPYHFRKVRQSIIDSIFYSQTSSKYCTIVLGLKYNFFVFVWKNIKPTPRNSKKQWGIWESQVSQSCFKNLADDMWIISFDVRWLKSKWPS